MVRLNMCPSSPLDDVLNPCSVNAVFFGEPTNPHDVVLVFAPDDQNNFIRQFGLMVLFPWPVGPMDFSVVSVLFRSPPAQVVEVIVDGVAIRKMPALHARRAGTDERFQDKTVNQAGVTAWVQINHQIAPAICTRRHLFPFVAKLGLRAATIAKCYKLPAGPDRAISPDPIARESRNVAVLDRIGFSHDRIFHKGAVERLGNRRGNDSTVSVIVGAC